MRAISRRNFLARGTALYGLAALPFGGLLEKLAGIAQNLPSAQRTLTEIENFGQAPIAQKSFSEFEKGKGYLGLVRDFENALGKMIPIHPMHSGIRVEEFLDNLRYIDECLCLFSFLCRSWEQDLRLRINEPRFLLTETKWPPSELDTEMKSAISRFERFTKIGKWQFIVLFTAEKALVDEAFLRQHSIGPVTIEISSERKPKEEGLRLIELFLNRHADEFQTDSKPWIGDTSNNLAECEFLTEKSRFRAKGLFAFYSLLAQIETMPQDAPLNLSVAELSLSRMKKLNFWALDGTLTYDDRDNLNFEYQALAEIARRIARQAGREDVGLTDNSNSPISLSLPHLVMQNLATVDDALAVIRGMRNSNSQ